MVNVSNGARPIITNVKRQLKTNESSTADRNREYARIIIPSLSPIPSRIRSMLLQIKPNFLLYKKIDYE
jgi:hypothetical protein